MGEAARKKAKGGIANPFSGPRQARAKRAAALKSAVTEHNKMLAKGFRRLVIQQEGLIKPFAASYRVIGWTVAVETDKLASGGNAVLVVAGPNDPERWSSFVEGVGGKPADESDKAMVAELFGADDNPCSTPETVKGQVTKAVIDQHEELEQKIDAGRRRFVFPVGIAQAMADAWQDAEWGTALNFDMPVAVQEAGGLMAAIGVGHAWVLLSGDDELDDEPEGDGPKSQPADHASLDGAAAPCAGAEAGA